MHTHSSQYTKHNNKMHGKSDAQCDSHKGKITNALVHTVYVNTLTKSFSSDLTFSLEIISHSPPNQTFVAHYYTTAGIWGWLHVKYFV